MMDVEFEAKDALVILLIGAIPFVVIFIIAQWVIGTYRFKVPEEGHQALAGFSPLLSSAANRLIIIKGDDSIEEPSSFMYISSGFWTWIYLSLGILVIANAVFRYYHL